MRYLGSVARVLKTILPPNAPGWILVGLFVVLAALWLLAPFQAKLGSFVVPAVGLGWFLLLGAVSFFVAPRRSDFVRPIHWVGVLIALGLLVWPISVHRRHLLESSAGLTASVRRASQDMGRTERIVVLESLRFDSRRELNRLVGRRRDVVLDISGHLFVPRAGTYRFELSCDDQCSIRLDDRTVLARARAGSSAESVTLEKGRARLAIHYHQIGGPAYFRVSWNRPGFVEILPLDHYVDTRPDRLTSGKILWRQVQAYGMLVSSLVLWSLMFCILLGLVAWLRSFLLAKARMSWLAMKTVGPAPGSPSRGRRVIGIFALAFVVRVAFVLLSDQPLLFHHQYNYFTNAMRIVEHPQLFDYVLRSDEWRDWMGWTIAPLYYLFVAAVFEIFGPHLLAVRLLQCALDSAVAVAVASLGRRAAGAYGIWAGIAYAVYWPAIEMTNYTMTENLHTVLLVGSLAVMAAESERPGGLACFSGGFLLGLSALTRAVSSAFVGVAALWRLSIYGRSQWLAAVLIVSGAAAAVGPWTARNVFIMDEWVPIESVSFANLFEDNILESQESMEQRGQSIGRLSTESEKSAAAAEEALRGVRESPDRFLDKVRGNYGHLMRADGLHHLLRVEQPHTIWEHAAAVLLGDFLFAAGIPLFLAFALGGRPSPTRRLLLLWCVYYFALLVVVFHVEVRYRSALTPVVFAGAVGGVGALSSGRRKLLARMAFGLGLWLSLATLLPFLGPAWRAVDAALALRPARSAIERGDLAEAERIFDDAAARDPTSARPWFQYGRWLAAERLTEQAVEVYRKGGELSALDWIPRLVLPQLLDDAGSSEESTRAIRIANRLSWAVDPWIMLEIAWRELPPPRTDQILLGRGDYGAVRGFLHPRGGHLRRIERQIWWFGKREQGYVPPGLHRWSLGRAWLRLVPTRSAAEYLVTIEMGSPFPSPHAAPDVILRVNEGEVTRIKLGREIRPYVVAARLPPGEPIVVCIEAATWSRAGEPAAQGVRVDRMTVSPAP